ncbi:MAG: NUDIX domain-containing protein [Hyphomicrobiaceae bacterium]
MARGKLAGIVVGRALQSYWRVSRGLTMGAQGVVLDQQNRVILIRHTYRPGWHFPGGGVESNETLRESLARELEEEAGVVIEGRPQLFSMYANFRQFPSDHVALFVVRDWRQPVVPEPNREIAEVGSFDPLGLPEGTAGPVRRRLDEILHGRPPDEAW